MKKKHFYLLPFEIEGKGYVTPGFLRSGYKHDGSDAPIEIQKKRDEIFTSELEAVINKVTSADRVSSTFKSSNKELQSWIVQSLPNDEVFSVMEDIYLQEQITVENIQNNLKVFFSNYSVTSFAILLLNEKSGCYYPVIYQGLDDMTSINLLFTFHCEYLSELGLIHINDNMRNDIFFRKKFSPEDLDKFHSIEAIPLKDKGLEAYCLLFHENDSESVEILSTQVSNYISHLVPALNSINDTLNKLDEIDDQQLLINVYSSFSQYIYNGKRECLIHKVTIENFHELDNSRQLKNEVIKAISLVLDSSNMLVENKIDGFILFSRTIEQSELYKIIQNSLLQYKLVTFRYPDHGTNLFTYFY